MNNLSQNHTLQLTTLRTSETVTTTTPMMLLIKLVTTTTTMMLLIKAGDSLTDVQWLLYLQDHGCKMV